MDNAIERNINLFFQDPRIEPVIPGKLSVLYLLRRDVMHCFDHNIILFPATMTILAGIDLLAKFYAGNDKTGQVGARFKNLIKRYFSNISNDDAIVLYQLRNALLHSFGLFSRDNNKDYSFALGPASSFINRVNDMYYINPWILRNQFEEAIQRYRSNLDTDSTLCAYFQAMFPRYGTMDLTPA